jgi:transmembrane sensor
VLAAAVQWHGRARAGLSATERAAFLDWLHERPEHAAAADVVSRSWDAAPAAARQGGFAPPHIAARSERPARAGGRRALWGGLATGGAALAALALWAVQPQTAAYATGPQERRTETLADGTRVWLAPGTRLASRIGPFGRQVTLERGEAAFDVVHELRGFRVEAGTVAVVDRGTLFTVRHRAGRPVTVTLAHGALRVDDRASDTVLAEPRPGEQVEIADGAVRLRTVDAADALAWREGRLVFADQTLDAALAAFRDQGAAPVRLRDPRLGNLRVSGAYAAADITSFLAALSSVHPVRWHRTGAGHEIERR